MFTQLNAQRFLGEGYYVSYRSLCVLFVKLEVTGCVVSWSRVIGVYTHVFLLALVHVVDRSHLRAIYIY